MDDLSTQSSRNFIDELIAEKVAAARSGNKGAAKWVLGKFVSAVRNNTDKDGLPLSKPSGTATQVHEDVIRYVAYCFESILDGVPAEKALGLNKGESGADAMSAKDLRQREYEWCLDVLRNKSSGRFEKLADAKAATARRFQVSISAIDKAWKKPAAKLSAKITMEWNK